MAGPAGGFAAAALRLAGAGVLAGVWLTAIDLARLWAGHSHALSRGADAVAVGVGAFGALTLCTTLLALVTGGYVGLANAVARRLPVTRLAGAALAAAPTAAALALLNLLVLDKAPLAWVGLVAAAFVATGVVVFVRFPAAGAAPRWSRWPAVLAALALTAAATQADATLYVGLYPEQHRTLALVAALGALWFTLDLRGTRAGARIAAVLLAVAALAWAALFALSGEEVTQNARYLTRQAAPLTGQALDVIGAATDWDGDGVPALLGAGDCDNADSRVHPGAPEIPDNGLDDDCLGGDLDAEARAGYLARTQTPAPRVAGPPPARHLVFVSIDALRWDRFAPASDDGPAGDGRPDLVPNLRQLARQSTLFTRMYAPYPSTILSLYGVLTSRYPSQIELSPHYQFLVPGRDPSPTLAELLSREGFHTGGFWFHHIFAPQLGIGRGFETSWVESATDNVVNTVVSGAEAVDRALAWVDGVHRADPGGRLFLWVHLYDPHEPYLPHPEYDFGDSDEALYDAEVAYSDAQLGRLVEGLRARGVLADAALWFFADHGEEFDDHGGRFHATSLYEELVHVPALLALPGRPAQVLERPLSLLDLAPTSLDLLGLANRTPATQQGRSLVPLLMGAQPMPRPVFLEAFRKDGAVLRGVVDGPWKLVHWRDEHFFELYNLEHDPAERANVFDLLPEQGSALARLLGTWVALALGGDEARP